MLENDNKADRTGKLKIHSMNLKSERIEEGPLNFQDTKIGCGKECVKIT